MKITLDIPAKRIADLMVSVMEGNSMTRSWCEGIYIKGLWERRIKAGEKLSTAWWYASPEVYEYDFTVEVVEIVDESKDAEGDNLKRYRVNQKDFAEGFARMAALSGHSFGDFMAENDDSITADVWIQCVALGEVRYG